MPAQSSRNDGPKSPTSVVSVPSQANENPMGTATPRVNSSVSPTNELSYALSARASMDRPALGAVTLIVEQLVWVTSGDEMIDGSGYHREHLDFQVTRTLNGYSQPLTGSLTGGGTDAPQSGRVYGQDGVSPSLQLPSSGIDHVPAILIGSEPPSGRPDSHAKICPSPEREQEWEREPEADSPSPSSTLWSDTTPPSSSSKTYRDFSLAMEGKTWQSSSVRWSNSGMAWPTGYLTLATSECRSDDDGCLSLESRLTDVMEQSAPRRFYLSATAARGILRRAEKRGRSLPAELDTALRALAASDTTPTQTPSSPTPSPSPAKTTSSVRRLSPTECERLMSYPDGWTIRGRTPIATDAAAMESSLMSQSGSE